MAFAAVRAAVSAACGKRIGGGCRVGSDWRSADGTHSRLRDVLQGVVDAALNQMNLHQERFVVQLLHLPQQRLHQLQRLMILLLIQQPV